MTHIDNKKKVLAANMWSVWDLGNTNQRYQNFLSRGRPEFISFIEQALLYDEVHVPTQDFLSLAILLGVLGEDAVQDLLASNTLKFTRLKGAFAYVGNGGGIINFEVVKDKEKQIPNSAFADTESTIKWVIDGLSLKSKDPHLWKKVLNNTVEIKSNDILNSVRSETYKDILSNQELQNYFALGNKDLNKLKGIKPNEVRVYGGKDTVREKVDVIDTYLMLNNTNVELKLMELAGCVDMTTSNPIGHLLKAKFEREKTKTQNSLTILKEIADIPDFGEAVLQKSIKMKDLLVLKESIHGGEFRNWFHNNCQGDERKVAKEYVKMLEATPKISHLPYKILRFLITTGVGFVPVVGNALGATLGLVDTFFIEKWTSGKSPKFFINDLKQINK